MLLAEPNQYIKVTFLYTALAWEHLSIKFIFGAVACVQMADIKRALVDWFIAFVKSKDIISRKIESLDRDSDGWDLVVRERDRVRRVLVSPHLDSWDGVLPRLDGEHVTLVVLNTSRNLDAVIAKWSELAKHLKLVVVFANPYSVTDKCWQVYPSTHDRVTERRVLRRGLEAMAANVEQYTDV